MEFVKTYAKELVSVLVPLVTAIIGRILRSKVRLIYASPHEFTFLVPEPLKDAEGKVIKEKQTVHTRSFWFRNEGKAIAHHVEIVFNYKPLCLNIWPVRHCEFLVEADGRNVLKFDTLAPGEDFVCELLNVNNDLPVLVTVRCDEGIGKSVPMFPQRTISKWRTRVAVVFLFVGFAATLYLAIVGLQWLILKTPVVL